MFESRGPVDAGGLISYGASASGTQRQVARQVDLILKGAKPADLPIEQPTEYTLVVNLQTAKAIGITVPRSVLERAEVAIE